MALRYFFALMLPFFAAWAANPLCSVELEQSAEVRQTRQELQRLLELKKQGLKETVIFANEARAQVDIRGVPPTAKGTEPTGMTFRHYASPQTIEKILREKRLKAGPVPYAQTSPGIRNYFSDLHGIFLTTPDFKAEQVGLDKNERGAWVDLKLPALTGLLFLENGIYLVPTPQQLPDWLLELYQQHKAGTLLKTSPYLKEVQKIEENGGPNPPFFLPVEIVGRSP